jgi:D-alanyl-D-alanine-carboxypeptidase/D-alanyl-D-alanine-endopeptidase
MMAALVIALTVAPAFAQKAASLPDLQTAGALGADVFARSGSTGMVLVVVRGDQVFFRGYGETGPGSGQVPDANSVVRLCSLTKIFTSDVLSKLVADGTLKLGDPLQRFAPRHAVVPIRERAITLEDLATHTAGLPREIGTGPRGTPHFTYPDYKTRWRWLPQQHLNTMPGTAALYSNVGYDLLADALEAAAHKPYARLLAERSLNPLAMGETTFYPNASQCARLLKSYGDEGPCTVTESTDGSSGLYSTSNDMAKWLKYLLGAGEKRFPAQEAAAQGVYLLPGDLKSVKGLDHAGTPTGIGLGWMHLLAADDPRHLVEKTGGGAGYSTYIAINHARHAAVFLAATDGSSPEYFNHFKAANNLLLTVLGLPQIPPDPPKVVVKKRVRRKRR